MSYLCPKQSSQHYIDCPTSSLAIKDPLGTHTDGALIMRHKNVARTDKAPRRIRDATHGYNMFIARTGVAAPADLLPLLSPSPLTSHIPLAPYPAYKETCRQRNVL